MQRVVLGQQVAAPEAYAPEVLCAVPRSLGREKLALQAVALPFAGVDVWNAYELSWRDARGRPQVAVATLTLPCTSPNLVESKSLKLYLNGLYFVRFPSTQALVDTIARDVGACVGAHVQVQLTLPAQMHGEVGPLLGESVDDAELDAVPDGAAPDGAAPDAELLRAGAQRAPAGSEPQRLTSRLLRSLCPVTSQPDWADLQLELHGVRLRPAALLGYVLGFARHTGFHEQCVERIYLDVMRTVQPRDLAVYARYTRRGGIDINPYRCTPPLRVPPNGRTFRQ